MNKESITVVVNCLGSGEMFDVAIPLSITAQELIVALNALYDLGMDLSDRKHNFIRSENPIAFIKGAKQLKDYGLRDGTTLIVK